MPILRILIVLLLTSHHINAQNNKTYIADIEEPNGSNNDGFVITFSQPVQRINPDVIPIQVSPKVQCFWSWIDHRNLSCELNDYSIIDEEDIDYGEQNVFKSATQYTVSLGKGMLDVNNNALVPQKINFVSHRPKVDRYYIHQWLKPDLPVILINVNQKIKPKSLLNKIYLKSADDKIPLQPMDASKIQLNKLSALFYLNQDNLTFVPERPLQKNQAYKLHIDEGIESQLGTAKSKKYQSDDDIVAHGQFSYLNHRCFRSYYSRTYPAPCYADDGLIVDFSSYLSAASLKQCKANKNYSIEKRNLDHLTSSLFISPLRDNHIQPQQPIIADCVDSLRDEFNRPLKTTDFANDIKSKGFRPSITLKPYSKIIAENGTIQFSVESINVNDFMVFLEQVDNQITNTQHRIKVSSVPDKPISTSITLQALGLDNEVRSIKGHIRLSGKIDETKKDQSSIAFAVQKSPYLVNFKYNANHAAVQISDIKGRSPLSNHPFSLSHNEHNYDGLTDENGFAQIALASTIKTSNDHDFAINVAATKTQGAVNLFNINQFPQYNDKKESFSIIQNDLKENSLVLYGMTDKPIYRPGETVKYTAYLRQKKDKHFIIPQQPIVFKIHVSNMDIHCYEYDQCDSFYVNEVKELDQFGGLSHQFSIPKSAANGNYSIGIILKDLDNWNNEEQDTNLQFKVSHFKDSAYKLSLTSTLEYAKDLQEIPIKATAEYYSGGFVSDEQGEIAGEVIAKEIDEAFVQYDDYDFNSSEDQYGETYFLKNLRFNSKGIIEESYTIPENTVDFGEIKLNAGIKPKNGEWNYSPDLIIPYHQKDYFIGLKFSQWQKTTSEALLLEHIVIDFKGIKQKPHSLNYAIQKSLGSDNWSPAKTLLCTNKSKKSCRFMLDEPGRYKISTSTTIDNQHYANDTTFYVQSNKIIDEQHLKDEISITTDKPVYHLGDIAQLTIKFPKKQVHSFITVERNAIVDSWLKSTQNGQINLSLKITENHAPGFDVSAIVQSYDPNDPDFEISEDGEYGHETLTVSVILPEPAPSFSIQTIKEVYQPKDTVVVDITSHFNTSSQYVVAVVDQSVIDLVDKTYLYNLDEFSYSKAKHYWELMETSKIVPEKYISQEVALTLLSQENNDYLHVDRSIYYNDADYYSDTEELDSITITGSNITRVDLGAYANEITGKPQAITVLNRETLTQPLDTFDMLKINKRDLRSYFAESAFYSSDTVIGPQSSTPVTFELPDNVTQWRIIVLGTDKTGAMAFQQTTIKASKDLELRSTLPLQLTKGDQFTAEYSVVSKTRKKVNIQTAVQAQLNGQVIAQGQQTLKKVKKLTSQPVSLSIDETNPGTLQLSAIAKTKKNADGLINTITVREDQIPWSASRFGQLDSEKTTITFDDHRSDHSAQSAQVGLNISSSLMPHLNPVYPYMHQYPHQCWEQKSAKAIVAAIELEGQKSWSAQHIENSKNHINSLLNSAADFQTSNGGMTFFGGQQANINVFLSLYTLQNFDFLRQLGHQPPKNVSDRLKAFINTELLENPDWLDDNVPRLSNDEFGPEIELLVINLLKNMDKEDIDDTRETHYANRASLSLFALNQLLTAYHDEPAKQKKVLASINDKFYQDRKKFTPKDNDYSYWYLLPSALKDQCDLVSQQLKLDESLIKKNELIKHINAILEKRNNTGHFGSTLENAYCSKAIYQFAKKYESHTSPAPYSINIGTNSLDLFNGELNTVIQPDQPLSLTINNPGQQQTYYTATVRYPVQSKDIKKQAQGFNLQRQYFVFRDGKWTENTHYTTGDWVKTVLTIHSPIGRKFVALSNPVPGGWLPTDPNLASNMPVGIRGSEKPQDNSAQFYERQLNPDTTRFYANYLNAGTHRISYYSQVRNAGTYQAMPAVVEEMYDEENRATTETRTIVINK